MPKDQETRNKHPRTRILLGTFNMKFIHAADLHIDSPLDGLSAYEGAPVELLRTATRTAF